MAKTKNDEAPKALEAGPLTANTWGTYWEAGIDNPMPHPCQVLEPAPGMPGHYHINVFFFGGIQGRAGVVLADQPTPNAFTV